MHLSLKGFGMKDVDLGILEVPAPFISDSHAWRITSARVAGAPTTGGQGHPGRRTVSDDPMATATQTGPTDKGGRHRKPILDRITHDSQTVAYWTVPDKLRRSNPIASR
jgi:hypothetical protein